MNILNHTIAWHKGEIFEAILFGGFGLLLIIVAVVCWSWGKTPNAQALVIPLLVVGVLISAGSISNAIGNSNKIKQITAEPIADITAFAQAEIERVEGFQYLYTVTKIMAGLLFFIAIGIFFLTHNRHWQAAAISIILLGLTGLTIDYFSKERADQYYQTLLKQKQLPHSTD